MISIYRYTVIELISTVIMKTVNFELWGHVFGHPY